MRYVVCLALCVWLWSGSSQAQSSSALLARRVRVVATNMPLHQVLRDIARQSGVSFSYSSTFIPLQKRVTLHTKDAQPVREVLKQLFQNRGVSYQVIGGQIVLWRTGENPPAVPPSAPAVVPTSAAAARPPAAVLATNRKTAPPTAASLRSAKPPIAAVKSSTPAAGPMKKTAVLTPPKRPIARAAPPVSSPKAAAPALAGPNPEPAVAVAVPRPAPSSADSLPSRPAAVDSTTQETDSALARLRQKARTTAQAATNTLARTARQTGRTLNKGVTEVAGGARAVLDSVAVAASGLKEPLQNSARRLTRAGRRDTLAGQVVAVRSGLPARDTLLQPVPIAAPAVRSQTYDRRRWQISFVAPLGTNWLRSGRSINTISLNALAGYSAGVRGVELGGILNVVRDTMQGVQGAGIANVIGTEVNGIQGAGVVNVVGGSVRGMQGAGIANVVRDDARGIQLAGIVNIVGGAARSDLSGRPTWVRQLLGLPRLLATDSAARYPGAPSASSLPGSLLQAAAVANLTGTDIRGLQTATLLNTARRVRGLQLGLVNVAKHVHGVQFGLINIADSVEGATLGIINIVRHGYLHGEVWASETLPLNAALKLGVTRYYTILSAATQPFGTRIHWATGFGIGTASRPHGRFSWNLDLLDWYLLKQPGTAGTLLSYTQLRPSLTWQIEPQGHLGLVFSPTLNMGLYENEGGGTSSDFGKNQLLLLDTKSGRTLVRLWPGVQIGLRF
ncbi:LA_2272 family surface repeat-containing protein [Hymenobacter elongatus]|uniref:DUF4974 domain-containing protein n=1 Tax=Hymenobacter elongatus TaxID=877208 RepID=A0A4Z0PI29_9BACT|nr:hypothetical protein [Hymenobacter elongatus]TGE14850.1 hypothetical protein E5J99_14595 [Hymenobacter elongatus]